MDMLRHQLEDVQGNVGVMVWQLKPNRFYDSARFRRIHLAMDDLPEQRDATISTEGDRIHPNAGVIETRQSPKPTVLSSEHSPQSAGAVQQLLEIDIPLLRSTAGFSLLDLILCFRAGGKVQGLRCCISLIGGNGAAVA
jgi:hypothetical protein